MALAGNFVRVEAAICPNGANRRGIRRGAPR